MLGATEMLIVAGAILAVVAGPSLLPRFGRGLGQSIKEFRNVKRELNEPLQPHTDAKADRTGGD